MEYVCKTPVVMIVFNRPQHTQIVFDGVKRVKPVKLYIISDGSRTNNLDDEVKVKLCREIVENVDWNCEITKIYSDKNFGCKKRVITGINEVFAKEERAIILEDDCVPSKEFFEFCDWGLDRYENNSQVAIISGSNLLDFIPDIAINDRAGFSKYINCWGWATWKETWLKFDSFLSIQEINKNKNSIFSIANLDRFERLFWLNVFKHSVYTRSIWDFYLQYVFFDNSLVSVYPKYNLVRNIGFGIDSTHTVTMPNFVKQSLPDIEKLSNFMSLKEPGEIIVNEPRDNQVVRIIYGYNKTSTIKLILGNNLRYNGII